MNSPMSVRNFSAPIAAPLVAVGRTIEHAGSFRLKNIVGSGMIRLVWNSSPPSGDELRSGNTSEESFGSVRARCVACLVAPSLKVHCLGWTDAEDDAQNLRMGNSLGELMGKGWSRLARWSQSENPLCWQSPGCGR